VTPSDEKEFNSERRRLAALAESTLKFRRIAADTLDSLLVELIGTNSTIGIAEFETLNGRPCRLMITVGEDTSNAVDTFAQNVIQGE
jgi:hypothetical protein